MKGCLYRCISYSWTYSGIEPITNACNCLLSKEYQLNSYRCAEQAVYSLMNHYKQLEARNCCLEYRRQVL